MKGGIMILFDSLSVRREALDYAIELAKRTDSSLMSLFLIDASETGPDHDANRETEGSLIVQEVSQRARRAGLQAEAEVRSGNPSSELMKYLADYRSPQAIVWGGQFAGERIKRHRNHWFFRIKDSLGCPVFMLGWKPEP